MFRPSGITSQSPQDGTNPNKYGSQWPDKTCTQVTTHVYGRMVLGSRNTPKPYHVCVSVVKFGSRTKQAMNRKEPLKWDRTGVVVEVRRQAPAESHCGIESSYANFNYCITQRYLLSTIPNLATDSVLVLSPPCQRYHQRSCPHGTAKDTGYKYAVCHTP